MLLPSSYKVHTLHSAVHSPESTSSLKISDTSRAPYTGGLEYIGRITSFSWDPTRAAYREKKREGSKTRKDNSQARMGRKREKTILRHAWVEETKKLWATARLGGNASQLVSELYSKEVSWAQPDPTRTARRSHYFTHLTDHWSPFDYLDV